MDSGFYVPGALGEWTVRTSLRLLTLYEQREVRDVPGVRLKALYPTTPVWWEHVEVPRGMAARVPQMVALQGSQLMGEPLGGPYLRMWAALWAVEVADVFLGSIRHHGHLWRLPMAIRSAFADLTPERFGSTPLGVAVGRLFSWGTPRSPSGVRSSLLLRWVCPVGHPSPRQPGHMVEFGAFPWGTPVHTQ